MSQDKQQKKNRNQKHNESAEVTAVVEPVVVEKKEVERGERGELGQATPGLKIQQMWHEAHFTRVDVGDKHNPRKRIWEPNHNAPSLKMFARQLATSGNKVAKDWFANKNGKINAKRSEKNQSRVALEKQASKAARRKNSQKNTGKSNTEVMAAANAMVATVAKKGKK